MTKYFGLDRKIEVYIVKDKVIIVSNDHTTMCCVADIAHATNSLANDTNYGC